MFLGLEKCYSFLNGFFVEKKIGKNQINLQLSIANSIQAIKNTLEILKFKQHYYKYF